MSAFETARPARNRRAIILILLIFVIGLLGAAYYLAPRFERKAPQIKMTPPAQMLAALKAMGIKTP